MGEERESSLFGELALQLLFEAEARLRYREHCFWTSPDCTLVDQAVLPPNVPTTVEGEGRYWWDESGKLHDSNPATEVRVLMKPDVIPFKSMRFLPDSADLPVSQKMFAFLDEQGAIPLLLSSTKSRLAQLGIELSDEQYIPGWVWRELAKGKELIVPGIRLNNYAARTIVLEPGTSLFRLGSPLMREELQGAALLDAYRRGLIAVEGEQGTAWDWISLDPDDPRGLKHPSGIYGMRIRLLPGLRWLPPADEPLFLKDLSGPGYREKIDRLLEPVPYTDKRILCIGETYPLHLDPAMFGLINLWAGGDGRQINSRFIDGGSGWGIRIEELLVPNVALYEDRYMEIHFYHKQP